MKQSFLSHTVRITFTISLLFSSFSFCPSSHERSATPIYRSPSYEDLERNYQENSKLKRQLAQAIEVTDFETFKMLYTHVDPNFAIPCKEGEPIVPLFRVLEIYDQLDPLYRSQPRYYGHTARRLFMLELLLKKGADPHITNNAGKRPIDLANEAEAKLLQKYMLQDHLSQTCSISK